MLAARLKLALSNKRVLAFYYSASTSVEQLNIFERCLALFMLTKEKIAK